MTRDPVCGVVVNKDSPGAEEAYQDHRFYFCSEKCKEEFNKNPERYATSAVMMR